MSEKYFPINTATSCQLKWTWSTVYLYTGKTNSCHRVDHLPLTVENFNEFHNLPKKINDRQLMLDGKWPTGGCEYCMNIENAGGQSDRQFQIQIPNLVPPELDVNPTATHVTPRILEIYLDNVCNMSCIYCHDEFSSRIQKENERYGTFSKSGLVITNKTQRHPEFNSISQKFWHWLETNYPTLRRMHLLGGEPFFQSQFETCLEFLETHVNKDLEFNIVSNLKLPQEKLELFVERIKKLLVDRRIKRFDLTASIDCWGPEQEYIRHGIDLKKWCNNFEYLVNQKWVTLNINQTITSLGIKSMPKLIEYLNQQRENREIGHYLMSCNNLSYLYPGIFGKEFFDKDFETILNLMPEYTWQQQNAKKIMQGLQLEFNTHKRNQEEVNKLKIFLDEIDRRRGLNWRNTFPWLEKEIKNVV